MNDRGTGLLFLVVLIAACGGSGGCGGPTQLMATPNLYAHGGVPPFADVPPELRNNRVEVLYLTDRAPAEKPSPAGAAYSHKRSRSVAFGACEVQFGKDVSWDELVRASTTQKRSLKLDVELTKTTELCRFPPTPKALVEVSGPATAMKPGAVEEDVHQAIESCRRELVARLDKTPVKEVYIYVHGVKNSFEGAVMMIAQLWHFLGRQGVPIAYTWPAGGKGILRGYNYDYNSSEFTVYHLKEMLRVVAATPAVEKLHLIAHSRGTDALVSALRELHIEISASGRSTREVLKLATVVLAAPDLDVDVVIQRASTARLGQVPERSTVYICDKDEALGFSRFLFGSLRLGALKPNIFTAEELKALRGGQNLAVIDARVTKPGSYGHNYFYSNPAVSSDLILLMRYHRRPGAANGRPLRAEENGFWFIDDNYAKDLAPLPSEGATP
jgi:esterase/lipase superfamily enzyme